MENASKALIIAGAILIAIVLITVGVVVLQQGQDVAQNASMDDQVVSSWNQKWTQFEGQHVSGSNVNTLISQVLSSNVNSNRKSEVSKIIQLVSGTTGTTGNRITATNTYQGCANAATATTNNFGTSAVATKARPGVEYTVNVTGYNGYGYVCQITISPNT